MSENLKIRDEKLKDSAIKRQPLIVMAQYQKKKFER